MLKTRLKDIRELEAIDLSNSTTADLDTLPALKQIAYSVGTYNITGGVWIDEAGKLYKVVGRSSILFIL